MTTLTQRRIITRERRNPLLLLLAAVGAVARWLAARIPEPRTVERYTGHFGADNRGKLYDQLTAREHDELAAWWNRCEGDEE